ncbi:DMT family transporter [Mycolicibacterium monacense]|uniref:QacE family quaternary ammonium compound efflux SMR transporter n=2 Tax=Mycobacteriaceae TaxID=1762 RepID=A0AAD1J158_MYCMB|nr:multidrug efflux SMR transporter [Mycolicibacterium monacense]MDA4104190.1 ligand-binding protein SH3 [Mycolicibacterium monacense DSM 44395]OBB73497.1 ligand-binding protein SH3 [Mycolicibacterium monacense]OBF47081.1 ligand-binding protein SH3 [Mycolicibacterium monacense]ORB15955.1 QacE family quaternary ammonium compound efflux SMR transporter [Mycolicibacterium monacense DSM 44395]QHP85039.1 multidrug efflux SMR transporter [Mycolicibacterium monacense DSM 44395]
MSWLILIISGAFEAVWAVALSKTEGFTRPVPSVIFVVAVVISMAGLGYALRDIPVGTGYAVWVGIGAALTVAYSLASGEESVSVIKVALLLGIVGCVVGLQVVSQGH